MRNLGVLFQPFDISSLPLPDRSLHSASGEPSQEDEQGPSREFHSRQDQEQAFIGHAYSPHELYR